MREIASAVGLELAEARPPVSLDDEAEALARQRDDARNAKDWDRADRLRPSSRPRATWCRHRHGHQVAG